MNKILDIAFKDLLQAFRSAFALVFMFVVPLLVTTAFYFMFGKQTGNSSFSVPVTKVVIANLDQGDPAFTATAANFEGPAMSSLGQLFVHSLSSPDFASLLQVTSASSAEEARSAVDEQKAGVAVIIPPDLSATFMQGNGISTVKLYSDPTLSLGPGIVHSLLKQVMDSVSGGQIAVYVAQDVAGENDQAVMGAVLSQYLASQPQGDMEASWITNRSTIPQSKNQGFMNGIIGPIMGGMTIFYAFYTGFASGQTILREEERKTLPRLFTTPTPQSSILAGKFLAVFMTVIVQLTILLLAGWLIFKIEWGSLGTLAVISTIIVSTAATFGIFFSSLLKNTKQSGAIFGGVLTITGMVGMISIFTMGAPEAAWSNTVSLIVPQGWAVQALMKSIHLAPFNDIFLLLVGMLAWSIVFFTVGVWRFNHRYV